MRTRWMWFVGAVISVLIVMVGFVHSNAAKTIGETTTDSSADEGETHHITLITGDQVIVKESPDGTLDIDIESIDREGKEPQFEKLEKDDDIYVFPQDMVPFTEEKLDPELFNITRLIEDGYSDEEMDHIPLIITWKDSDSLSSYMQENKGLFSRLNSEKKLTSIHSISAKLDKDDAASFHEEMYTYTKRGMVESPYFDGIVSYIRLDRKLEAALGESVPQIGAPDVWKTGYDGSGMTIAVIDSGIDGNHPDLKDKVTNEKNFSEDPIAEDLNGHGTHVASTIAGSGVASDGERKGVAPGASLLNAKALDENGKGLESGIISAMEWSTEQGADVINMSLGSGPTDGTDPVSQALDALTEESGVLFVVASGNNGPLGETASAPSTADLALAVGSVDKNDELAPSSSRGPRVEDYAIKPDITAPGVGITAARADGTSMGAPVDTYYTDASGTSMAAPHVAGSAALLLEKWKETGKEIRPEHVKSALVSSATPNENLTVYEQGGGRVDIERALHQDVFVDQAPLDMGYFEYPYSDYGKVEKPLIYYNMSDETVVLDVEANIEANESIDIPEDFFTLDVNQITIEPGKAFELGVHLDIGKGESGLYGGYITAESEDGDVALHVPVGFYMKPKTHLLTVKATERNGNPALYPSRLDIMNEDRTSIFFEHNMTFRDETGEQTFEVPEGTYTVMGQIYSYEETDDFPKPIMTDVTLAGEMEVEVTGDTVVHLDAREGKPIKVDLDDDPKATLDEKAMTYYRKATKIGSVNKTFNSDLDLYAVPMGAPEKGEFEFNTSWHFVSANDGQDHAQVYNLVFPEPTIPQDLHYHVMTDDLAHITHSLHTTVPKDEYMTFRHVYRPYTKGSIATGTTIQAPAEQQEYVVPGDTEYKMNVEMKSSGLSLRQEKVSYPAEGLYGIDWFKQPFHPGIAVGDAGSKAIREGNQLHIILAELVDSDSHWAFVSGLSQFNVFQDGDLIGTADRAGGKFDVTSEGSEFKMELITDTSDIWAPFSTKTNTTWTFYSGEPRDNQPETLPLLVPDYDLDLTLNNTASLPEEVDGTLPVVLRVDHLSDEEGVTIEGVNLWISYNDGDEWEEVTLDRSDDDAFTAYMTDRKDNRDGSGYISLKVEAWDVDQNRVEQEIIRAYRWNCEGDVNGNGMIDIHDVLRVVAHYGTDNSEADINGDGIVGEKDMRILEKNFLKVAPDVDGNASPLEYLGGKGIDELLRSVGLEPLNAK